MVSNKVIIIMIVIALVLLVASFAISDIKISKNQPINNEKGGASIGLYVEPSENSNLVNENGE